MPRAAATDWLPSDSEDDNELSISWPTSSPCPQSPEPSEAGNASRSRAASVTPFNSGQRIDSSDPGVDLTSPAKGPPEERKAILRAKGHRKRRATIQHNREEYEAARAEREREAEESAAQEYARMKARLEEDRQEQRATCFRLLRILQDTGISLGSFLLTILDPEATDDGIRRRRWDELYGKSSILDQILGFWTKSAETPPTVRSRVNAWMVSHVSHLARREGRLITASGSMRWPAGGMAKAEVLSFRADSLFPYFEAQAPVMLEILYGFSTSRQQESSPSGNMLHRKQTVLTQVVATLLREHSRQNNLMASYNGIYLYAAGAQRQTISVLSHSGWSCSYPKLIGRARNSDASSGTQAAEVVSPDTDSASPSMRPEPAIGIIPALSAACRRDAQVVASEGHYKTAYDNVNFTDDVAEQILGRKDAQINMTNATAVPAQDNEGKIDVDAALSFATAEEAFLSAPELEFDDLVFTREEAQVWDELLEHATAEIIVDHGEDHFERFRTQLEATRPVDEQQITRHKTTIYPLETMDIDEALITGNIEIVDDIHVQLGVDLEAESSARHVRLFFGDQLTVARQRSIIAARAGHERHAESWRWAKPVLALFHTDMAAVSCAVVTHFGKPDTGTRNPGSLWFHNNVLDRKPIVLTSLPPYRVCRDLISVSLYARVLHCLLLVSDQPDLRSCAASIVTWDQLQSHARAVCNRYASTRVVSKLRRERASGSAGDLVFENAVLFLRDALGLRAFSRAVKTGRSGHIVLALKWLALMFKAGGHTKYAREMLFLIHHIARVWPPGLRDLVLGNWLVNPTGTKDGWVALDLMQEHLNFWIKKIYAAHGSNASWEWLAMISPCIEVLRGVANQMHSTLGSYQGRKHTSPDLTRDISRLMNSLEENGVYTPGFQRQDPEDDVQEVTDLLTDGAQQLLHGSNSALNDYNAEFRTLQARCRVRPLEPFTGETPMETESPRRQERALSAPSNEAPLRGDVSTSDSDSASSTTGSDSMDEFEEYDELFLRLIEEEDVDLDLDSTRYEVEGSEDGLDGLADAADEVDS